MKQRTLEFSAEVSAIDRAMNEQLARMDEDDLRDLIESTFNVPSDCIKSVEVK